MTSKLRVKTFAKEYVENGLNATKVIKKFRPALTIRSQQQTAHRLLNSVEFQKSVKEVIEETPGLQKDKVLLKLSKNIHQEKHIPSSNTAIDIYMKLEGDYAPDKKQVTSLTINLNDAEQVRKRIKDLKAELEETSGANPGA